MSSASPALSVGWKVREDNTIDEDRIKRKPRRRLAA
jgi:hypothetical protein